MRPTSFLSKRSSNKGAALIIVLAFVVLLTGLAVAYLSHATTDRQLAHTSFNDTDADVLARSALDTVIGDLKQEIKDGSNPIVVNGTTIYIARDTGSGAAANMVPQRSGNPSTVPNLIRRSVRNDSPAPAPGRASLASAVNSSTVSANGRSVTSTRWNSHYLVPKKEPGTDDSLPIDDFTNAIPDWVFVKGDPTGAQGGPAVITSPNSLVIGRYAYAVYDEGGLLDVNLAGFPTGTTTVQSGRKGSLAYADLGALPYPIPNGPPLGAYQVDKLVGWRNYATTQPLNFFPNSDFAANFQTDTTAATNFHNYVINNTNGFLAVPTTTWIPPGGGQQRTDQAFLTRQELIAFRRTTQFSANALQHLGTFSREQNIPTWLPSPLPPTALLTRFPIGQLGLVSVTPPTGNSTDIHTYFGLQWDTTNSRWQYVEGGTTLLPTISPVTSGQPNLFQVLNYVVPGHTTSEILQLGACVIDQYDADGITTQIEYASPGTIAYGREGISPPNPPAAPEPPSWYIGAVLNRPFRNVGELGYVLNPLTGSSTLDFRTSPSTNDNARLLDFFTINTVTPRAGIVNLNTRNPYVLAAIIKGAIITESPLASVTSTADATTAANSIVTETTNTPATGRPDVARLASLVTNTPFSTNDETRETIARALAEVGQVRTWGLLIDVIAQTGKYAPGETDLTKFIVEGEQHYWVHVAIDRFTGQVIDKQVEVVTE